MIGILVNPSTSIEPYLCRSGFIPDSDAGCRVALKTANPTYNEAHYKSFATRTQPLDARAERLQLFLDAFVAAIDVIDAIDNGRTLRH